MASLTESLNTFLSDTKRENKDNLIQFLQCYMLTIANGQDPTTCFINSDPLSVLSLLVQELLSRFRHAFIDNTFNETSNLEESSLREFLYREEVLLLLATIYHICMEVQPGPTHLELVELLIIVMDNLLGSLNTLHEVDNYHQINSIHLYSRVINNGKLNGNMCRRGGGLPSLVPVMGPETIEWIHQALLGKRAFPSRLDQAHFFLLLGVVEGLTCRSPPRNNSQLTCCLQILNSLTDLMEKSLRNWFNHLNHEESRHHYASIILFSRLILRVWLVIVDNTTSFFLSSSHVVQLQAVLPRPITMVTDISTNIAIKNCLFKTNRYFDAEFTLLYFESLYVTTAGTNMFITNTMVTPESFFNCLHSSLTDATQEWLLYICSKLQTVPRDSNQWDSIIESTHTLISKLTRELIVVSDHIHSCQKLAKSYLLNQSPDQALKLRSINSYNPETSLGFDKLEMKLCKISQSLLSIFDTVPSIQLLALQLLAQTGLDKVGIISDFLPQLSQSSVWSMPEVLDLYLELLEKAWLQVSSDFAGSSEFWSKLAHYKTPLSKGDCEVSLQVMYHLSLLYSHSSHYVMSAITHHIMIDYHLVIMEKLNDKVSLAVLQNPVESQKKDRKKLTKVEFSIEEEKMIHQYLKLVQKLSSHPSSLVPFLQNKQNLYSIFLFLPVMQFRMEALAVFGTVLHTLSRPWEASVLNSSHLSGNTTHISLINGLLQIAYEFREGTLVTKCEQLSLGKANISKFNFRQVDEVHVTIQNLLDDSTVPNLVKSSFIDHLMLVADVWNILTSCTTTSEDLLVVMNDNGVWDVVQVLSPSLAGLLERLHQYQVSESPKEFDFLVDLVRLQETCVSLLCHLLSMATIMSRLREDPHKVLELHCKEVHEFLKDSRLCSIPNSHTYLSTLMKVACHYPSDFNKRVPQSNNQPSVAPATSSSASDSHNTKTSPVISRRKTKICPVALPVDVKSQDKPVRRVNPAVLLSPGNHARMFYSSKLETESDHSGYDGDTEISTWLEGPIGGEDEEEMSAGVGRVLRTPLVLVRVPDEINNRMWLERPIWQCLDLLKECISDRSTVHKCDTSVELYLSYMLSILKADRFNLAVLAGKGLLSLLLEYFTPYFDLKTERSKNSWLVMCQIIEVLSTYQVSHSDLRKLFLKLQINQEQIVSVLHKVAEATHCYQQPSSYILFKYSRPSKSLKQSEMLSIPNPKPAGLKPCTLSLWLSVAKYPLSAYSHVITFFTGDIYLQVWTCSCSGDIVIMLSDKIYLTCLDTNDVPSVTIGSALSLNSFHHLFVSVKATRHQYKLLVVVDGVDVYDYELAFPTSLVKTSETQCFLGGGGVVSTYVTERHIKLVNAEQTSLTWRLGSFHIQEGFCGVNLATLLYQLGPECSPSSIYDLQDLLTTSYVDVSNSVIVNQIPITESELYSLQWPIISYSAHQSQRVFLVYYKEPSDEPVSSDSGPHNNIRVPSIYQLQWQSSLYAISQPQLLHVLQSCIGLEQLVYLYAKTVSEGCSVETQYSSLCLVFLSVNQSPYAKKEFHQLGGIKLLQQVLRTGKASLTQDVANVFLDWCCGREREEVKNVEVLEHILLDWHIWFNSSGEVWYMLLGQLEYLLNTDNSHVISNQIHFNEAKALVKILLTSKELLSLDTTNKHLDSRIAMMFVRLVGLLLGDPPSQDCLKYIWDHLLLPELNDLKIVRGSASESLIESELFPAACYDRLIQSSATSLTPNARTEGRGSSPLVVPCSSLTSVPFDSNVFPDIHSDDEEDETEDSDLEVLEFDIKSKAGRLPDSSYTDEETLFTWSDITGLPFLTESSLVNEAIPTNLETGLLSLMRKTICLLPDSQVHKVLGPILDQESIVVMANNPSILVRTAVVRVLHEFFRRAGESSQANFLQVKGFNLLGIQLKQYSVSFELMSALFSIVLGQEMNLSDQSSTSFQIPPTLTSFQSHAVIPILVCAINTASNGSLCHSTLCMLKELFEMIKGMPLCMLNNGLFKMICQLLYVVTESALTKENKQLILNDLFGFCKLIILYTLSSEQDETYRMFESFLICLRHFSEEVAKTKGPLSLPVIYTEQFIYMILAEGLSFFTTCTLGDNNTIVPLQSCQQVASLAELNNRFMVMCSMTVDWLIHGSSKFTDDHASILSDGPTITRNILFDKKGSLVSIMTSYVRYLINYFYRSIQVVLKKGAQASIDVSYRFIVNSRTQLFDNFARLFGYLISPAHSFRFRAETLKEFEALNDFSNVLNSLINSSQYKKLLCGRLVLSIVDLTLSPAVVDDDQLTSVYNSLFKTACNSGLIRLKNVSLTSIVRIREEEDQKTRMRIDGAIEDLKNADIRWIERTENANKDFNHRMSTLYKKLLEKTKQREQIVNRASAQVTDRVFVRQRGLKKNLIEQIEMAGVEEKNTLRQWKKIIIANTHPRAIWSSDEKRPMCWQLDPTEGPSRVRRRLIRAPRVTDKKFLLPEAWTTTTSQSVSPLVFIFERTAYDSAKGLFMNIVRQPGEEIISNYPQRCYIISPDSCCPGNLLVSNISCHFIGDGPLANPNITKVVPLDEKTQLLSWRHIDVVEIHPRRYMLKDNALEIFLINGITLLLAFDTNSECSKIHGELLMLDMPNLVDSGDGESSKLKVLTVGWQQGEITNFEYLMELNKLAGRTFNDLMQYPVFPFIISDYRSNELNLSDKTSFRNLERPISIQDDSKIPKYANTYQYLLQEFNNQGSGLPGFSSITAKPYHYGSHYSNSGIVLHFLVRIPPFTNMFLDFQGKSFDIADRSFHNVATTYWLSSSESATDVKELIPEFFYFPEFLTNSERFKFGEKQSGEVVDDVRLPPWAGKDPRLFILKHRQALESEYVSKHLHLWIDLVFGYKQTGKAAVNAMNVFHPATYYGADGIDIDSITDQTQQEALKTMVKTYGQMPLQLFKEPHPSRSKSTVRTTLLIRFGTVLKRLTSTSSGPLKIVNPYVAHRVKLIKPKITGECEFIGKTDFVVPHRPIHTATMTCSPENLVCLWNGEIAVTELDAAFFPSASQTYNGLLVTWGHWDNSLIVTLVGYEQTTIRLYHPPLNRVTCCQCVCNGQVLVSAGIAGVVSFWKLNNSTKQGLSYTGEVTHLRGHYEPINCLVACKPYSIVVSGSADGTCIIWDTNRLCYINTLPDHKGPVTCIAISPTIGDIATVSLLKDEDDGNKSRTQTCALRIWTINGRLVETLISQMQILSLCYTSAPEGVHVNVIIGGMADGTIKFWSSWDLTELNSLNFNNSPVLSLAVSSCSTKLYAGYSSMQVVTWVKPETDPDDSGDYVVVSSTLAPPTSQVPGPNILSANNILKYF